MSEHPGLTFATLDVDVEDGPSTGGWSPGARRSRGFYQERFDDQRGALVPAHPRGRRRLRGVWPEAPGLADPDTPVATYSSWPGRLNVGGGRLLEAD